MMERERNIRGRNEKKIVRQRGKESKTAIRRERWRERERHERKRKTDNDRQNSMKKIREKEIKQGKEEKRL